MCGYTVIRFFIPSCIKDKTIYSINDAELTPLQVLREIQYIFARQYDEAYKLIEDIFTKVDAEPNIHNKFKYTVAMLYNTARGT